MPTAYANKASKATSLFWVTVSYVLCCGAAYAYMTYAGQWHYGNGIVDSFIADTIATVVIFAFSRLFKNSSFYDPFWTVIPPLFLVYWWCTRQVDADVTRYIMLSIVVWFWALRLTWNWAKHWPNLSHEDWRYPMLKEKFPSVAIFVDFFGIHFFPTVQVFLGMLPMYACVALSTAEVNIIDYIAFVLGVAAPAIQLIADRQLHSFIATRKDGDIIQHGLWAYSRHPNYFGEVLFWFSLGLFGLAAYPEGWWWQMLGFIAMTAMFIFASIPMMEVRSLERRPQYQDVIDRISMLIPLPQKK